MPAKRTRSVRLRNLRYRWNKDKESSDGESKAHQPQPPPTGDHCDTASDLTCSIARARTAFRSTFPLPNAGIAATLRK